MPYDNDLRRARGPYPIEVAVNTAVNVTLIGGALAIGLVGEAVRLAEDLSAAAWMAANASIRRVR